mgnify:CR=1 FL=1
MTALQQAEHLLARMTPAEKARLIDRAAREFGGAYPGIEHTPGVCGGEACLTGTRIPVWLIVKAKRGGMAAQAMSAAWPGLTHEQIEHAVGYALTHVDEIEDAIHRNEAA